MFKYDVYVLLDKNNVIAKVASNLEDTTGMIKIDSGQGDKYSLAQNNYFPKEKPLRDGKGNSNYKLVDGKPAELTEEEKEKLFPTPAPQPSTQDTLNAQLLKANAEQQTLNANLLKQLAQLQGGSKNA